MRARDWEKQADLAADRQFVFPGIPLSRFAHRIREKLKIQVMRVVGEPDLRLRLGGG